MSCEKHFKRLCLAISHYLSHLAHHLLILLVKSHLQLYPCPLQINYLWNLGFLLRELLINYYILLEEIASRLCTSHLPGDSLLTVKYISLLYIIIRDSLCCRLSLSSFQDSLLCSLISERNICWRRFPVSLLSLN